MKKRHIFFIFFMIFILSGCQTGETYCEHIDKNMTDSMTNQIYAQEGPIEENEIGMNGNLFVNGNSLSCDCSVLIHYSDCYVELPLIAIMESLGSTVEWQENSIANIKYNNKEFVLDPINNSLSAKDKFGNYIALPPGTTHGGCYRYENDEYFVDSDSIKVFLNIIDMQLTIDYENSIVYLESK